MLSLCVFVFEQYFSIFVSLSLSLSISLSLSVQVLAIEISCRSGWHWNSLRLERLERSAWNQPCTTCIRMARFFALVSFAGKLKSIARSRFQSRGSGALPTERSLAACIHFSATAFISAVLNWSAIPSCFLRSSSALPNQRPCEWSEIEPGCLRAWQELSTAPTYRACVAGLLVTSGSHCSRKKSSSAEGNASTRWPRQDHRIGSPRFPRIDGWHHIGRPMKAEPLTAPLGGASDVWMRLRLRSGSDQYQVISSAQQGDALRDSGPHLSHVRLL